MSHAPREPSIKEDDDEHSESTTAGNTTSSNSTLPVIGGGNGAHASDFFNNSPLNNGSSGLMGGIGSGLDNGSGDHHAAQLHSPQQHHAHHSERSVTPLAPASEYNM